MFLIGLLIFWGITYAAGKILHAEKHGFKILLFFLSYRSNRFKEAIEKIGEKNTLFWKTLSNLSVAFAIGLTIYVTYFLSSNLLKFFSPVMESVPVLPIVPAITIRLDSLPYFFAAVTIIIIFHELAHGVSAVAEKVAVKSAGLAVMLTFFGGFVEPEEKSFENASRTSKLRILSVGSATNLMTGFLALLLLAGLFAPSSGVLVGGTVENGPLASVGVQRFDVIYTVNNTEVNTLQSLADYLANVTAGAVLVLKINDDKILNITTENVDDRAVIGLSYGLNYHPCRLGFGRIITANTYLVLYWIFLAAFSVAVFNMLPVYPFDGEKLVYYCLEGYVSKEKRFSVRVWVNVVFLGLLLSNMVLSLWWFGLLSV